MSFLKNLFNFTSSPKPPAALDWVVQLEGLDDTDAIELATRQLNADFSSKKFNDELNLQALLDADENVHNIVERITAQYIQLENFGTELDERISNSVFLFHRQIFVIYLSLLSKLAESNSPALVLILSRAMYNAIRMVKWRYFSYQSAPFNVWLQISQLFKIAESKKLLSNSEQSYSDQEFTTLSTLFVQAYMLGTLENLSFKRQQLELVSKMLGKWANKIVIEHDYDEKKHLFYVDTKSNVCAKRTRRFEPRDNDIYWDLESINAKVDLCLSAIEFNISPKQLLMNEFINNRYSLTTLEILKKEWSKDDYKRQRRTEERVKTIQSATSIFGFDDICNQINHFENLKIQRGVKYQAGGKSFEERLASHHAVISHIETRVNYLDLGSEAANIMDESPNGLCIYVNKKANEVSLCMMIGISVPEHKYSIKVGVIRSINPIATDEIRIGVELLNKKVETVVAKNMSLQATKLSTPANFNNTSGGFTNNGFSNSSFANSTFGNSGFSNSNFGNPENFTCLYLPKEPDETKQDTLVIPKVHYNKKDIFKVHLDGKDTLIRFIKSYEHNDNWVRVTYMEVRAK